MDKRINYRIVLDTETCPLDKNLKAVTPSNMFAYDIGWAVVDKKGNVYKTRSFVNAEIYLNEKALMESAYYAKKLPQYEADIKTGKRTLARMATIRKTFLHDVKEYNVKQVYAHNMRFDYGTLNNTQRWLTKSKYRYFFPYGIEICDTLRMARDVLGKMPTYKKFCEENGYLTKNHACRFTAEIIYRYITGDHAFTESHTGLEDVMIEKDILAYCFRQHKKMNRLCWGWEPARRFFFYTCMKPACMFWPVVDGCNDRFLSSVKSGNFLTIFGTLIAAAAHSRKFVKTNLIRVPSFS